MKGPVTQFYNPTVTLLCIGGFRGDMNPRFLGLPMKRAGSPSPGIDPTNGGTSSAVRRATSSKGSSDGDSKNFPARGCPDCACWRAQALHLD